MKKLKVYTIRPKSCWIDGVTIVVAKSIQQAHKLLLERNGKEYVDARYNFNSWQESKDLSTPLSEPKIIFDITE